jgi:pimeloyl-ACP methyl ester carboxylesterase
MITSDPSRRSSIRCFARKAGRMILIFVSILLACILILVGFVQLQSPGKPSPYVDGSGKTLPNSLSEKVRVDINGVEQGMFIKSKDVSHPVLLYLHGGMPDYFLTEKYPTGLEDPFIVCYWEQRGTGLSYDPNAPRDAINTEQMISDTLAVTNYLRQRFGKEKIYLMGHSGGSVFGIQAAARAPELYYAYIGEAQITDQLESERLAYEYMLAQYKANGNQKMVQRLEAAPVTLEGGTPAGYLALRDEAMHPLGIGTMHTMNSVFTGLFLPSWLNHDYTLAEKLNFWRAKAQSGASVMWPELTSTDLRKQTPELAIPVYFFEGIYDYTCSYTLAKSYYQSLKAPVKGFYTFAQSAHSPMFEEPEKMQQILREDVLAGANRLADAD